MLARFVSSQHNISRPEIPARLDLCFELNVIDSIEIKESFFQIFNPDMVALLQRNPPGYKQAARMIIVLHNNFTNTAFHQHDFHHAVLDLLWRQNRWIFPDFYLLFPLLTPAFRLLYTNDSMFDEIAKRYDFLNHLLSFGQDYYWRSVMTCELGARRGERMLDLATGTGDSSIGLLKQGANVIGLDLSFNMLKVAQMKIAQSGFAVMQGSAYEMPFRDASFDGLTCSFGIRNMHETPRALAEIFRVVKPGGRVVMLEFSMPYGWFRPLYRFYIRKAIPAVAALFSERSAYEYLGDSIENFYSPAAFRKLLEDAGFVDCRQIPLSLGTVYAHRAERPAKQSRWGRIITP